MIKKCLLFFLLIVGLIGSGCGRELSLDSLETVVYTHSEAGYTVTLPKAWAKQSEDKISASFSGEEPPLACNFIFELGGFDYYSIEGLIDEVSGFLQKDFTALELAEKPWERTPGDYRYILDGSLKDGEKVRIYSAILCPETGIRYYLFFTAAPKDFNELNRLFEETADSFKMIKPKDELYRGMSERGADEEAQPDNKNQSNK